MNILLAVLLLFQESGKANIPQKPIVPPPLEAFPVRVDPGLRLTDEEKPVYEQVAKQLATIAPMPTVRPNFYAAVLQKYKIRGWGGILSRVEPIQGGYLVTVRILPDIEPNAEIGPVIAVYSRYAERYRFVNEAFQYVGFLDPDNMFGKMPPILSM